MMIRIGWDARSNSGLKTFANRKKIFRPLLAFVEIAVDQSWTRGPFVIAIGLPSRAGETVDFHLPTIPPHRQNTQRRPAFLAGLPHETWLL